VTHGLRNSDLSGSCRHVVDQDSVLHRVGELVVELQRSTKLRYTFVGAVLSLEVNVGRPVIRQIFDKSVRALSSLASFRWLSVSYLLQRSM
jgi:hypothetical protein